MTTSEFWQDLRWGEQHHSKFLTQYKDQWVAIMDKKIIASGINLAKVKSDAQRKTGKDQIPVLFIDCGEHIYGQR